MGNVGDGILLVDKNEGETSFEVVKKVRRFLRTKKVGHAGTLDPFATGLLVILLGQGTKLFPYLQSTVKKYLATMTLGVETDTQDPTGRVVRRRPVPEIQPELVQAKALRFIGEVEQAPPVFSALKHEGKRAYEYARKGIHIELKKRKVNIYSLEVVAVNPPEVTIEVACSGGTYIRSLAADLGEQLGAGAHLTALRRLSVGSFEVDNAVNLKKNGSAPTSDALQQRVVPLRECLPHMIEIEVDGGMAKRIRDGYRPQWGELAPGKDSPDSCTGEVKVVKGAQLVAILKADSSTQAPGRGLEIMRVFK